MNSLDNREYIEKRARMADDAEAGRDVLAAQNARRFHGISQFLARFDGVLRGSSLSMSEMNLMVAAADDLERANAVREGDPEPKDYLFDRRLPVMEKPVSLLIVSVEPICQQEVA